MKAMQKKLLPINKFLLICLLFFSFSAGYSLAEIFESLNIINTKNWSAYFNDYLGYLYDSHGCLHFSPSDIYLLVKTLPKGTPLTIKKYVLERDDPPFALSNVPRLCDLTSSTIDIAKHAQIFKTSSTEVVVYPSLGALLIMVNGVPYAQVQTLAGPLQMMLMAFDVPKDEPIDWDFTLATPTDAGRFVLLGATSHYLSNAYYNNTIVPFGAWMVKKNGKWLYQEDSRWYVLPEHIVEDLNVPLDKRKYNYYDQSYDKNGTLQSARWAGHDFGKYVLLWTKDGKIKYPEMGYAAGELLYEQIILAKDLVDILTSPGADDLDACVARNKNFAFYKELADFVYLKKNIVPSGVNPALLSYYRLYNGLALSDRDYVLMDQRLVKAFEEYRDNRLPRETLARRKALGLVFYLRANSAVIEKQAYWYQKLQKDWSFWQDLRVKLRADFQRMGVMSLDNRQNLLEKWLTDRLEFKLVGPPSEAKYVQPLSFTSFFKPDEEVSIFTARERAVMQKLLSSAGSAEVEGVSFYTVKALNDYNFGMLLNDILGDLYKSHGCLHVSPRNMDFLYQILPLKTNLTVYDYANKLTESQVKDIPYLANLVNFKEDLEKLKAAFMVTDEVKVAVYPQSGMWIFYLKEQPFAKMQVKGGPQAKFYLVQDRDTKGRPIFEDHLAYPTTPGNFRVLNRVENYISNIYYDTTIIPMGGEIRKEKNKWIFLSKKGEWQTLPESVKEDIDKPEGQRVYTYYDEVKSASGEVIAVRWGSHPFGCYSLQTTLDGRSPFPELIHSSGDLMMEERQLVNDLIKVLTAPQDDLEKCIKYDQNFDLYKTCADFVANPDRRGLLQGRETANYRLYYGFPLTSEEAKLVPRDAVIADKILRNNTPLTEEERKLLVSEGIAYWRGGKLKINMEKVLGLNFDTYQYVVAIQKYAHHYTVLRDNWEQLNGLRQALLKDFNNFVIKDPVIMHNFFRELMLRRTKLEKLTQQTALEILRSMLENQSPK